MRKQKTIGNFNVSRSPSVLLRNPPPSRREANNPRSGFHLEEISSKLGLDLTRQRRISLLPRHFSFLISHFSFLSARKEQFLISHFSFLICFLRPEKTKNPSQRTQKTYITRGVKNIYAVPPNFSRKLCPSFPSITRTSRRILISASQNPTSNKIRSRRVKQSRRSFRIRWATFKAPRRRLAPPVCSLKAEKAPTPPKEVKT